MLHVGPNQVTGSQSTAERKFSSKDRGTDDAGQTAGVVTRVGGVRATDTKEIKHSALGLKDSTATEGSNLKRRHGNRDLESSAKAAMVSKMLTSNDGINLLLHDGDTVGALDNLSRVLASGQENSSDNVGSVGVESTD